MPIAIRVGPLKLVQCLGAELHRVLRLLLFRGFGALGLVLLRLQLNC